MEDRNISLPDLSVSSFQAVYQARISPAEGRRQNAEGRTVGQATQSHTLVKVESRKQKVEIGAKYHPKPPKATPRPYCRHILGIDSGVQSHPKATLRLHQGSTKAT